MTMTEEISDSTKKSEGRALYGSREEPAYKSFSAPTSSGMETGKPRPPKKD